MSIYYEGIPLSEISKAAWSLIPRTQARIVSSKPVGAPFPAWHGGRGQAEAVTVEMRRKPGLVGHLRGKKTEHAQTTVTRRPMTGAEASYGGVFGGGPGRTYNENPIAEGKAIFNQHRKEQRLVARQQRAAARQARRDSRWS